MRIALILDNKTREYSYLQLLKKTLTDKLNADVSIIGSVAEQQRIYLLLYKIKPQIVFISQIVEDCMRGIAYYIKKSGGLVFVLPAEITVIPAISNLIVNKKLQYNKLLDAIFLPGSRMRKLYSDTDIPSYKMYVVGSPKIDVLVKETDKDFLKRDLFLHSYKITPNKKNVFIFTSFVTIPPHYLTQNQTFQGNEKKILANNEYTLKNKTEYIETIKRLTEDLPNCNIILKTHPLENTAHYQEIKAPNFFILPKLSLYNCLDSIDLAIHWSSTIATECWIKGIQTLQYIPIIKKSSLSEFRLGNPTVNSYEDLLKTILLCLNKNIGRKFIPIQKKFLENNYYKLDGKSSLRIAEICKKYARNEIKVDYKPKFSKLIYLITTAQKFLGLSLSRSMIGFFKKRYSAEYAIQNFVEELR